MDGEVYTHRGAHSPTTYRDVRVTLYDANESVIRSVQLGSLSMDDQAPEKRPVNITTDVRPKYVVIESPDFWTDPPLSVTAYVWNENHGYYEDYWTETHDQQFNPD